MKFSFLGNCNCITCLIFLIIFSLNVAAFSQDDIIFEQFNTSHGLSNNETHRILQDNNGFLWITTQDGLNRFDGYSFKVFRNDPLDTTSIAHNATWAICESKDGDLWFSTEQGLSRYNPQTENFTNYAYTSLTNIPSEVERWANAVLSIHEDDEGIFWLGTIFKGLTRFDPHTKKFSHFLPDSSGGIVNVAIWAVADVHNKDILWLGLNSGFTSFNKSTQTFGKHIEEDFAKNGQTWSMHSDDKGNIWVGTEKSGLIKYNPENDTYVSYKANADEPDGIGRGGVWKTFQDPDDSDTFWFGTTTGLYKYNGETGTFQSFTSDINNPATLASDFVWDIYRGRSGVTWIGTSGGLNKIDPGRVPFRFYTQQSKDKNGLNDNTVRSVLKSSVDPDILWIGTTSGGLNKLDRGSNTYTYFQHDTDNPGSLGNNYIFDIYEDPDAAGETLWLATGGGGLNRLDLKSKRFTRYTVDAENQNSISSNNVRCIYKTRDGMLWLATFSGVNRFDPDKELFKQYLYQDTIYHNSIKSLVTKLIKEEKPLAAILKPGEQQDLTKNFTISQKSQVAIIALGEGQEIMYDYGWLENANGKTVWKFDFKKSRHAGGAEKNRQQVWNGTLESGEYKLRFISDEGHSYNNWNTIPPLNPERWGIQLFEISQNQNTIISSNLDKYKKANSIVSSGAFSIIEDSYGMLWIGTDNGLSKLDRKTEQFTNYKSNPGEPSSIPNNNILCLFEDSRGTIWIGTGSGLSHYRQKSNSFKTYTFEDGLPNNTVQSILEDNNGHIWLATNNGISKFNPAEEQETGNITFINYNIQDGLQYNQYTRSAGYKGSDGEMFFGGHNGLVSFFPGKINPLPPHTIISDFRIFNESILPGEDSPLDNHISKTKSIALPYDLNAFSFEFVALHFSQPYKNQYLYMMVGFDKDWLDGYRRFAPYTNLDPGNYTFKVQASNSDGIWNKEATTLAITILPPWWRTIWAYIGYGLFFVGLIFGIDRFQRRRLMHKTRERMKIKEAEHRAETAELEARAAKAENERKSKELEEARALQLSMLPKELPQLPTLDIAVYMQTATEVGGDYYDFHVGMDGTLTVVIGDATGHGMKAGTMVTTAKSLFNSYAPNPDILFSFQEITRCIKQMNFGKLSMCMTMLKIKNNKLQMSTAGMPPSLIFRRDTRVVEEHLFKAMPLGTMDKFPYEIKDTTLNKGDTILLMSDGLPELKNSDGKMYGYKKIRNGFEDIAEKQPEEIISYLKTEGAGWVDNADPDDDVTFVVIKVK